MPETPKEKPETEKDTDTGQDEATWSEDQRKRGYYYDDSHGYKTYEPDDDKEEAD